jgi:glycine hydroxymethyltransferase
MAGSDFKNTWGAIAPKSGRIKNISELIDSAVMPGIQGGPLMHSIAGKAIAFKEALEPSFKDYSRQVVDNARTLASELESMNYKLVSGGTDTHLVLIDLSNKNITGKLAENRLEKAGITTNKNMVPFDEKSPMITSGIRIGTPAITTRGMETKEMKQIAAFIDIVLKNIDDDSIITKVRSSVVELCSSFKLYPNL